MAVQVGGLLSQFRSVEGSAISRGEGGGASALAAPRTASGSRRRGVIATRSNPALRTLPSALVDVSTTKQRRQQVQLSIVCGSTGGARDAVTATPQLGSICAKPRARVQRIRTSASTGINGTSSNGAADSSSPGEEPEPQDSREPSVAWSSRRSTRTEGKVKLPRPKRIILVRHGESEGNVDESAYTRIPDSRIALTRKGWEQARECGQQLKNLIEADGEEAWKVYFYVSPYKRTIQTLRGIGLAFERQRIAGVREEPRIREQDFGNFQCRERMRVEKQVRLRYGRFFYRFPDGESAADVYDRVTGFRETLRADIEVGRFQRPDFTSPNMNLVIVSHGLTLRVFLMRWFKWTVRQFEGLYNFDNASLIVMERGEGGRYSLRPYHSREELQRFGMTKEMILDQEWQINAVPGGLNNDWITSGPSFFDHFDENEEIIQNYVCDGLSDGCVPEEVLAMQALQADSVV